MSHKYSNVKLSKDEMDEKVKEFREWISTQPDLPQNIEHLLLLRYLKTYAFRLNRAENLLKFSFGIRKKNPLIFTNRDFLSPEIENALNICEMVPMLKTTPENYKCCVMRLIDYRSELFNFNDLIKLFFMVADVRLVSLDPNPDNLAEGEVPVFDMKGTTIWHVLKVSLSTLRLYFTYTQEAFPVRVQQVHVYNCSSLINRIMILIKPFLKPEVAAKFQFHAPGSDTIFKFIPREVLPEEYGGTAGPISNIKKVWMKRFHERRDYIMNDSNWIVNNSDDLNNNKKQLEETVKVHNGLCLPEKIAPIVLRRFLFSCYDDVEKTKNLIKYSYSLRFKYSHIFFNRDPLEPIARKIFQLVDVGVPMPSLSPKNYRVTLNRLIDHDPEKFDFDNIIKCFFLAADSRFSIIDHDLPFNINEGDVAIFDMTGFSYRHITKLSLGTIRCYMKFTQEAFPVRIKQIHLINVSSVLSKVLMILRPFMKASVSELLISHLPNTTTLYDHIPKEILPHEYGGKAGSIYDIKRDFVKRIEDQREYLINDSYWKPRDSNNNSLNVKTQQMNSNLKSLSID
ncbi:CLUMA_CG004239, isoform A [Clunio marinus]|uniref:CLUMA_CG004239, isoform A n=1 Tax=Clunio marinus TaxID=568069 RepID=A0A1J1HR64_9DIPT|nr:CLUMA_CG004239, isoform A [Clunio marinus]